MSTSTTSDHASESASDAPFMLSVSGARGIVGRTMTPAVAAEFAAAFAGFLRDATGEAAPTVCVGRDGRLSGEMIGSAVVSGLLSAGCRVVDLGVVTTPTVGVSIRAHGAHGGMAVTASHNPIEWNGLKSLDRDGLAPPPEGAASIIERFRERRFDLVDGASVRELIHDADATRVHVERVLEQVDVARIRAKSFHVVLDSVNASGCVGGRLLLEELGCRVTHLNGEQTGVFAHTPEPTEANLTDLARATAAAGDAVCGFAQDPDADRLAIVDEAGRYFGEEYTLVLCALRMLQRAGGVPIAANLSTSRMIDDLAAGFDGARIVRTAVGEANVASGMRAHDAPIGGEGNGGVILPAVGWVRDSLAGMALVLELLATEERPLSAIVADLPRYAMIKRKLDLAEIGGAEVVPSILGKVAHHFAHERVDDSDGVRIDFDRGWVHLRPSNTEPIIRLIAEAKDDAAAAALADEVAGVAGLR